MLPFCGVAIANEEEYKPYICIPFIPGPTYHRMKRACNKAGVNLVTKSGKKLKDILCSANITSQDPIKRPGGYEFQCPCSDNAKYVGQTTRSILQRGKEHGKAVEERNWTHSGILAHKEECNQQIDWSSPTVITTMSNKSKKKLTYDLKIREALKFAAATAVPAVVLMKTTAHT